MGRVQIDQVRKQKLILRLGDEATRRAAEKTKRQIERNIVQMGLINTSELLNSFHVTRVNPGARIARYRVYTTAKHWKYPEYGTKGSVAKPGKVLRFKPKGSATFIFRKRTGPVREYAYIRRALRGLTVRDFTP